jgi:hypothetical protein
MLRYPGLYIKEIIQWYMTDIKRQELSYLLLKQRGGDVDWFDFVDKAEDFTKDFDAALTQEYAPNPDIHTKFWAFMDQRKLANILEVDVVTEKIDPLLVLTKKNFDFVYFSVVHRKSLLHMGCWLCMPHKEAEMPHIMCCLLYATRVQKLSEWQIYATEENGTNKDWDGVLNLDGSLEFS